MSPLHCFLLDVQSQVSLLSPRQGRIPSFQTSFLLLICVHEIRIFENVPLFSFTNPEIVSVPQSQLCELFSFLGSRAAVFLEVFVLYAGQ